MKTLLLTSLILTSGLSLGQAIKIAIHNGTSTLGGMTSRPAGTVVNTTVDTWNNVANNGGPGLNFTNLALSDRFGATSGAMLAINANASGFNSGAWGSNSQDWSMMKGFYTFNSGKSLAVTNLPASLSNGYKVTLYGEASDARTMNYYLNDGISTQRLTLNDTAGIFAGNFVAGVNFVTSPVLTGTGFTLTFDTALNGQAGKASQIQGITIDPVATVNPVTRNTGSSGFWEQVSWENAAGNQTGGVNDGDSVLIGRYRTVTYRGIPAVETMALLNLGENSVNPGQGSLTIQSGRMHVTNTLYVGRNVGANDAFLTVNGGVLAVGGNAYFGSHTAAADGSLIVGGGTVEFGSNLEMGAFTIGGAMMRFHNPGSSPPVIVAGTLTLGRCTLDLTFDASYTHVPGTVIPLVNFGSRDGQFLNFRNGNEFNCGPNRFRITYNANPGTITLTALPNWPASNQRPNIIMILADDQGYADLSLNGSNKFPMPRLDTLASQGARFTDAYVTGGVCHPTRCAFMTGRYQHRTGSENNLAGPSYEGMSVTQRTIPQRLQGLGYKTYGVGKWHLGSTVEFHPNCRGFDRWYGMWAGSRSYYDATDEAGVFQNQMTPDFASENTGYLTDRIGDTTVSFIHEHLHSADAARPFFIYMAFNAVHAPMDIKSLDARYARLKNEFGLTAANYLNSPEIFAGSNQATVDSNRYELAAMTLALDENIGKVIDKVNAEGIANNTLIVYQSDNGGAGWYPDYGGNYSYNRPLSGYKGDVSDEGSIRVPCAAKWPSVIPAGMVVSDPISSLDWAATFVNAANDAPAAARNGLDGLDLLPRLTGTGSLPADRMLAWRTSAFVRGGSAARIGDWKLRIDNVTGAAKLFNLRSDIGEIVDRAAEQPAIFNNLKKRFKNWEARTIPPLYGPGGTVLDSGLSRWAISGGLRMKSTSDTPLWQSGRMRDPFPMTSDFAFSFQLRPGEPPPYASGAGLWQGIGDSGTHANLIRAGVNFGNQTLVIHEGKTGNSASLPLPHLPVDFTQLVVNYSAATKQVTLSLGETTVSLVLSGTYGGLSYSAMGASAMEGEVTTFRPLGSVDSTTTLALPLPSNPVSMRLDLGAEPAFDPVLERSGSLTDFAPEPEALVESLGGGIYQVTTLLPAVTKGFFRFRLDKP